MLQIYFSRRALKWKLDTQKALQGSFKVTPRVPQAHLRTPGLEGRLGTRIIKAPGHLGTWALEGRLGTRVLEANRNSKGTWVLAHLRHMGTWALRHSKGTWAMRPSDTKALKHLETWALGHSRHWVWVYYLAISFYHL